MESTLPRPNNTTLRKVVAGAHQVVDSAAVAADETVLKVQPVISHAAASGGVEKGLIFETASPP